MSDVIKQCPYCGEIEEDLVIMKAFRCGTHEGAWNFKQSSDCKINVLSEKLGMLEQRIEELEQNK